MLRFQARRPYASKRSGAAAAPYVQQLLYNEEVQGTLRGVLGAMRDAYLRGRGKGARQAVNDKELRRRLRQVLSAIGELLSVLEKPAPRRTSPWPVRLAVAALVGAGGFLALNADARAKVLALARKDTKTANSSQ
jgi:hypothetical protein